MSPANKKNKAAAAAPLSSYPGSKAGAGVYQAIINEIPPHDVYVEPFIGSGQIFLRKRPARSSIVCDVDDDVARAWRSLTHLAIGTTVVHGDARSLIRGLRAQITSRWLIYCDPPYVRSTRRCADALYRHELSDADHVELLTLLRDVPAQVMVSGYRCELYDQLLADWRRVDYLAPVRGGPPAVESLWCNFARPRELAEFTYLGSNFRERERIKRRQQRWRRMVAEMPELERRAMLAELARDLIASAGGEELASPRAARVAT